MSAKQHRGGNPGDRMIDPHFAFRGDRHRKDLWADLLPTAKRVLIDGGFFTVDGKITAKGLRFLSAQMTTLPKTHPSSPVVAG